MYIQIKTDTNRNQTTTTYINTDNAAKIEVVDQEVTISYHFISADDLRLGSLVVNMNDAEQINMMMNLLTIALSNEQ